MTLLRPKLIVAALAAAALLWPSTAESPVGAAALRQVEGVTIERQLIRVPVRPDIAKAPRLRVTGPNRLAAKTPVRTRQADGIAARAGRMLLGDGRYRPEPFPRPGR